MEAGRIQVKAVCVVRNGNEVLACLGRDETKQEDIARLMGGTVEFGETALEALRREFREELGTELEDVRFVELIENIFTYNGEPGHEIMFVYEGILADKALYGRDDLVILDAPHIRVAWVPLSAVREGRIKLYPERDYGASASKAV